jgi:hypothetical protein
MRRWTQEERERQAELIRSWRPWEKSTGPQTEAGKMRSSQNALVHGACTNAVREEAKKLNEFLRYCKALEAFSTLDNG